MSGISGKTREIKNFEESVKKVGLFNAKVIAINPNAEEFKELLGIDLKEDSKATEYLVEDKEGNTQLKLNIWVEDVKSGWKTAIRFFLTDKARTNKDGSKLQYINDIGTCSWASEEENLPDWFKKREVREAKSGEEKFYEFMRYWCAALDFKDPDTTFQFDWKKLMKGNVSEIKALLNGPYTTRPEKGGVLHNMPTVMAVVGTKEDGGEYQSIYTSAFMPEYSIKNFRLVDYSKDEVQQALQKKQPKDMKPHEKFVKQVIDSEYGCKEFYSFKPLKDYDPSENFVASTATISDDDAGY